MLEFNTTLLVCIVSFVIFLLMLNAILYEPLANVVHRRMRYINSNYKEAEEAKDRLQKLDAWVLERKQKSKEVAREVFSKVINEYKLKKETLIEYEHTISAKDMSGVRLRLQNIDRESRAQLKEHVGELAGAVVSKFLGYEKQIQAVDEETIDNILSSCTEEQANG